MTVLVDTHAFLWFLTGDRRLSRVARRTIEESDGHWSVSAASIWEIAIKSALGRLELGTPLTEFVGEKVQQGLRILSIDWTHAAAVERLPRAHRDPFDRLIIAQARVERLPIVTGDKAFSKYDIRVIW